MAVRWVTEEVETFLLETTMSLESMSRLSALVLVLVRVRVHPLIAKRAFKMAEVRHVPIDVSSADRLVSVVLRILAERHVQIDAVSLYVVWYFWT